MARKASCRGARVRVMVAPSRVGRPQSCSRRSLRGVLIVTTLPTGAVHPIRVCLIWSGGPTANRTVTKHKVVLVRFPFDDLSSTKVRPAVCLTEPIGPHQHLIVAFVSSRIPASPLPTDLLIDSRDAGFAAGRAAGLIHASTASLDDGHQSVAST